MKTLLLVDDLGMLVGSRNQFVKGILALYTTYLKWVLIHVARMYQPSELLIAGPSQVISKLPKNNGWQTISYDQVIDQIDWQKAGKISSELADRIVHSNTLRAVCPFLYKSEISIPKRAHVRLSHLFCYDSLANALMIEELITQYSIGCVAILGGASEMERIGAGVAKKFKLEIKVLTPNDFFQALKERFILFMYDRDRRLHAENELWGRHVKSSVLPVSNDSIVFTPAHSLHLKTVIPLAKQINQAGHTALVFLPESLAGYSKVLESEDILVTSPNEFSDCRDHGELKRCQDMISVFFDSHDRNLVFHEELTFEGIDWFLILENKIQSFFKWSFSEVFILTKRYEDAFRALKPKAVFVMSDARFHETVAAASAREMKIPVFFYSSNPIMALDAINRYDTGDFLMLVGPHIQKLVSAQGYVPDSKMLMVGDIRFDHVNKWRNPDQVAAVKKRFGIAEGKKIFILISWHTNLKFTKEEKITFFRTVQTAFQNRNDLALVIKAHPAESEAELRTFSEGLGMNGPVVREMPLYELFGIASGIIVTASMAALEAMMFDLPVLAIDLPTRDYDYYIPFKKYHGVLSFKNSEELKDLVDRLGRDASFLSDQIQNGRAFISRYVEQPKEGAAERIISVVNKKLDLSPKRKVFAMIQARTSSTRLPNKVFSILNGKTVLEHVIERAKYARTIDEIVVVTSREQSDDPIDFFCKKNGISCYRGSLNNVLERYVEAARKFKADIVVRITADSPLLEAPWIDKAVQMLVEQQLDHVNAKLPEEFPVGMGSEVITKEALEKSLQNAKTNEDFEHVTWYCLSHRNQFKIGFLFNSKKDPQVNIRLALDEPDDLKLLETVFHQLDKQNKHFGYSEIVGLYKKAPNLFQINQHVKEKPNLYVKTL